MSEFQIVKLNQRIAHFAQTVTALNLQIQQQLGEKMWATVEEAEADSLGYRGTLFVPFLSAFQRTLRWYIHYGDVRKEALSVRVQIESTAKEGFRQWSIQYVWVEEAQEWGLRSNPQRQGWGDMSLDQHFLLLVKELIQTEYLNALSDSLAQRRLSLEGQQADIQQLMDAIPRATS